MAQQPLKAVILTALRVEYKAVRAFLDNFQEDTHPISGTVYERGEFIANGKAWEVGIVEIGPGNVDAGIETNRAIEYFNPQVVLFVGIAGGIKDAGIGDVVAATKIYGYESGKAEAKEFKTRVGVAESSYALVQRARAESRKPDWLNRLSDKPDPEPEVWVQPIAAGEKVVASMKSSTYKLLEGNFSDAVAVEMEGYGFSRAVYASTNAASMVIRGISDLIDGKNDSAKYGPEIERHKKASAHASAFAFQILSKFDPNQGITGAGPAPPKVEARFWGELFACFQTTDLAFLKLALEDVLVAENRDYPLGEIETLAALKVALEKLDNQDLAVHWVKHLIQKATQMPDEAVNFTVTPALQAWNDAHKFPETEPEVELEVNPSLGYLLVTLEPVVPSGQVDEGGDADNVRLMAELHVPGKAPRTDFLPRDTQCSIDSVCDFLSEVVPLAGEVRAVEIFLAWQHLGQPVHDWKIRSSSRRSKSRRNQKELWRIPCNTIVRSLDRLQDEKWSEEWLKGLGDRWQQLQALEALLSEHTCCRECLTEDLFEGALDKKLVFKFLVTLPEDREDLADLLYAVVESKVPIWLWAYQEPSSATGFSARVDALLNEPENLREAAVLAQSILDQRQDLLELGLLFDCHTRIPCLPTLAVNEAGRLRQPAA